jgi:lipopolysaccharide/colanic/teichoic acid biosynthesis glycosyltransferase
MVQLHSKKAMFLLGDMFVFFVSLYIALSLRTLDLVDFSYFQDHVQGFLPVSLLFLLALYIVGLYDVESIRTKAKIFSYVFYSVIATGLSGVIIFYLFPSGFAPKLVLLIQMVVLLTLLFSARVWFENRKAGSTKVRALLIGEGDEYEELKKTINKEKNYSLHFVHHFSLNGQSVLGHEEIKEFHSLLKKNSIRIIVADVRDEKISPLLPYLYNVASDGILLYDMRRMYQDVFKRMPLVDVGYFWFFENVSFNTKLYIAVKRSLDVLVSLPLMLFTLLLYPIIAFFIRREDGGKVLIKQERLGERGNVISIYKFRTMTFNDKSGFGKDGKTGESLDNKVTRVGAILRKTRLDEFPQVYSVVKGDLSLIGPRAELVEIGRKMTQEFPYYMMRYSVRPGLSGWAQVNQDDGSPRGIDGHLRKLEYDFFYIKNRSLFLDGVIALRTIRILLSRNGV